MALASPVAWLASTKDALGACCADQATPSEAAVTYVVV
jgi:hypothetical protein